MSGLGSGRAGRGLPYIVERELPAPECGDGEYPEINRAHGTAIRVTAWVVISVERVASLVARLRRSPWIHPK